MDLVIPETDVVNAGISLKSISNNKEEGLLISANNDYSGTGIYTKAVVGSGATFGSAEVMLYNSEAGGYAYLSANNVDGTVASWLEVTPDKARIISYTGNTFIDVNYDQTINIQTSGVVTIAGAEGVTIGSVPYPINPGSSNQFLGYDELGSPLGFIDLPSTSFVFGSYSISGSVTQDLTTDSIIRLTLTDDTTFDYYNPTTNRPYFFIVDAGNSSFNLGTVSSYKVPSTQTDIAYGATGATGSFKMNGIFDGDTMNLDIIKDFVSLTPPPPPTTTYLFDESGAGGAYLAYSTRLLSSTYSGDCMLVRRSSDSTTQDIGFVDGLLDTDSLTTFLSGSTGSVTIWYDQTGGGRNAIPKITEPIIAISGTIQTKNGKPSIYFPGNNTGQAFKFNNATLAQPSSVFMLSESNATSGEHFMDGPTRQLIGNVSNLCIYAGSGIVSLGINVTTFNLITAIFNGSSSFLQTNDSTSASGNAGSSNLDPDSFIMSENNTGTPTNDTYGFVSEFIVYPSDMTSNLTTVKTNINEYFTVY